MVQGDGDVRIGGLSPAADRRALAPHVAYVPQIAPRLAAPVREVVAAVARLRGIDSARIAAEAKALELDLGAVWSRPFRALSGGMRQKVLASLALASGAEVLLLDEPTASMDPRGRAAFLQRVEELPGRPTVLLCSHRLDEIRRLVDGVVVLADGRVAWRGPASEYLAEHAQAVVEIAARGAGADEWLRARGFAPGAGGWWVRSVATTERAALVAAAVRELNGCLADVLVRDVERLEPPRASSGIPRGEQS
jgi:ABC-2 type transport system ATP-binding protein